VNEEALAHWGAVAPVKMEKECGARSTLAFLLIIFLFGVI
jgi:hypothetical protein